MNMTEREFRIAYAPGLRQLLGVIGCGPGLSGVLVTDESVRVCLGWAFRVTIPRHAIGVVEPEERSVFSVGVHGWRGTWLVNGTRRDLTRIELGLGVHARVIGQKVALTTLVLSVEDRDEFIRLIRPPGAGPNAARVAKVRRIRLPSPVLKPGLARDAPIMRNDETPPGKITPSV
jgi:hypothetical protein